MARTTGLLALIVLVLGLPQQAKAGEPGDSRSDAAPPAIASCVLEAPGRTQPLQILEGGMVLGTHPCSGGLYLLPAGEEASGPREMARAITLHQGWRLYALIGASWAGPDTLEVCGRFITGIGPSGATPFTARILARRQAGRWQTEQPVLADEMANQGKGNGRGNNGDGACAARFQEAP
ncbi:MULTISPECIES: hypothetical protein [Aphanothece]|uniref:hypothetical protein n=1 Tax=Aphanothece TaxID=1121 RepID=UPI00398515BA